MNFLLTSSKRSLHDPVQVLNRRSCGDPGEILVRSSLRGPCIKILQMPCLRGACLKALVGGSWEVLVSRSCKIRSTSSRSFYDDLVSFFQGSWHEDLVKVFNKSLCEALGEILVTCCQGPLHDLVHVLVRSS